jgi:hypothetical protein
VSAGWINAVAVMEPEMVEVFERIVEDCVCGLDTAFWSEDRLGVVLPTDEDEVLFRLVLLHDNSIGEICMIGERSYIIPTRYSGEVRRCVEHGLFDAALSPLTLGCLELRDASLLHGITAALAAQPSAFGGYPPHLVVV